MGSLPSDIFSASDYERHARRGLDESIYAFLAGGAGNGVTLRSNRGAFDKISVYNRVLRDVSLGSTSFEMLGRQFRHPVFLAPLAYQRLYCPQGELATAQAAEATDSCMVLSTLASASLEDIAAIGGPKWFQIYFQPLKDDTLQLVKRAEKAGYEAIVATVDSPVIPLGAEAARLGFQLPPEVRAVNLDGFAAVEPENLKPDDSPIFQGAMSSAPVWSDLEWLIRQSSIPVLIKGISHPDDAGRCRELSASGVIVSNHGGRSLDGLPGALSLLPSIRKRLGEEYPILFDSGVRSGSDVFKAIAMGADAVLVGRLQAFALSVGGALGVAHMIKLLREELELTMALAGCATLSEINANVIFSAA